MKSEISLASLVEGIVEVAKSLNIHPSQVTKSQFVKKTGVTDWTLRKFGGLDQIKKSHFPVDEKDLSAIEEMKEIKKYVNKLEKDLGQKELFEKTVADVLKKSLKPLKVSSYKAKNKPSKDSRDMIAMLNDVHYGLNVDEREVGGTNKYGWAEACRRTAFFVKQVCEYKQDKRDEVETLHFVLNGDILHGVIHGLTSRDAELMVNQMNGALHILTHSIAALAQNFKKVVVHAVPGNHDDQPHRREGGNRVTSQKYDSYCNMVYYSLSVAFRDVDNVSFNVPRTPYAMIDLPGGRAMVVHGDGIFSRSLGNPGNSLNIKELSNDIHRFSLGEIAKGEKPIKMVLLGHTHVFANFITNDGIHVINAPSLSGLDNYAGSLGLNSNLVAQVMFESNKDHVLGDLRLVKVDKADEENGLDKIIPIYKNSLSFE